MCLRAFTRKHILKHHALNFEKRVQLDGITNAERAFVFKLFLCNPFARSAGIFLQFTRFYALLSQLGNLLRLLRLLRLQFTPLTVQGYTLFKFYDNSYPFRVTQFLSFIH